MYIDYQSLKNFDLGRLIMCQGRWSDLAGSFSQQMTDYQQSVMAPVGDGTWIGEAHTAAQRGVARSYVRLVETKKYLESVLDALGTAVDGIRAAQSRLRDALAIAQDSGLPVDATGNVGLVDGVAVDWYEPPVIAAMRAQKMIYQARYMAYEVDQHVCPILRYAEKFGVNDDGPWLHEGSLDRGNAQNIRGHLPDLLKAIATQDPSPPPDTDAQPYGSENAQNFDYATWGAMAGPGVNYFQQKGWLNAQALFQHWLGNSGTTKLVSPDDMMNAMGTFHNTVWDWVWGQQGSGLGVHDSGWQNYSPGDHVESEDWYYAFNDFRWRVAALSMNDEKGVRHVEFTLGIKKPYEFGGDVYVGGHLAGHRNPIPIPVLEKVPILGKIVALHQWQLQRLHETALAQNFIAQGITSEKAF